MHILECIVRPANGDTERALEYWKGLIEISGGGFKNGQALSRMDGENSVIIIRHQFNDLAEEQKAWEVWGSSDAGKRHREHRNEYFDGPGTFHRYNVLHSYSDEL
jgi:hypothetical protein